MKKLYSIVIFCIFCNFTIADDKVTRLQNLLKEDPQLYETLRNLADGLNPEDVAKSGFFEKLEAILLRTSEYKQKYQESQKKIQQLEEQLSSQDNVPGATPNYKLQMENQKLQSEVTSLRQQLQTVPHSDYDQQLQEWKAKAEKYRKYAVQYKKKYQQATRKSSTQVVYKSSHTIPQPSPKNELPDENVIVGKGSSKRGAIINAWQSFMLQHIQSNIPQDLFLANEEHIYVYIKKYWRYYTNGEETVVKPYFRGQIGVLLNIKERDLLRDIYTKFGDSTAVAHSIKYVLIPDMEYYQQVPDDLSDEATIFTVLQQDLQGKIDISNSLGGKPTNDLFDVVSEQYDKADIMINVWVKPHSIRDPYSLKQVWGAAVGCRAIDKKTGKELWNIEIESGPEAKSVPADVLGNKKARTIAVQNVGKALVKRLEQQITEIH